MPFEIVCTGLFVLAEEIEEEKKANKLILTAKTEEKPFLRVVAAPKNDKGIIDGRIILLNNAWCKKITHKDKEYCIVPLDNIVGVLE
jgi:co-chaperonin GroES (HSP10)